ncbi:MAG: hypothetical protein OEY20_16205 [Gemmatimonadota bacterium]|nr:hypothetical protein [Gemmatimonadota bacterium]MDH5198785.1 hypothetical protein [Gemmatimonadota bacterium]
MSFMLGLRIFAVVMLGWVVAHSARRILLSVTGHDRLATRALFSEGLTGIGAFIIGLGLLPGGSVEAETMMMIVGSLVWSAGIVVGPVARATPST